VVVWVGGVCVGEVVHGCLCGWGCGCAGEVYVC